MVAFQSLLRRLTLPFRLNGLGGHRQLLKQPDYAGLDYEEGGSSAVIRCSEDCDGLYVTSLCDGKPEADSGKVSSHSDSNHACAEDARRTDVAEPTSW